MTEAKKEDATEPSKADDDSKKTPQRRGQKRKMDENEPFVVVEDEPDIPEDAVCLDWQNSDLSLKINKEDLVTGEPFFKEGWGYVWSGARATHGFTDGKVTSLVALFGKKERWNNIGSL